MNLRRGSLLVLVGGMMAACAIPPSPAATPAPTSTVAPSPTVTPRPTATPRPTPTAPPTVPVTVVPAAAREAVPVSPVGMDGVLVKGTDGYPWWNDTVFYEIFVRSFYDSDGDGVGDLQGLIEKLDYLNDGDPATDDDLGVTGLWLMPIMQSPSYHGYDVTDYYRVDEEYGTNEDFKRLMAEAHARGMRVIVDMVLNHTSSQHPWFLEARSDPNADKRDWYVWADKPDLRGWYKTPNGYYFALFWEGMPDLNYENPAVTEEMRRVIRFWLEEMGVDGFRLDAIKHLIEEGEQVENTPATHAWLEGFHDFYKRIKPDALTVGEVWNSTDVIVPYIGEELDLAFEFDLADATLKSAFSGRRGAVLLAQERVIEAYPPGQFATFLANHDQTRTRSRLLNDGQAKVAASLQLAFAGVPFVYYGEEIGMQGTKPDENIRRPMQWTAEGGFTTGTPWRGYYEDVAERNVAAQRDDPRSLWRHYQALIRLRNEHEALRIGSWQRVEASHRAIYSFVRASDEEVVLVVVNLSGQPVTGYSLTLAQGPFTVDMRPALLMGGGGGPLYAPVVNADGGFGPYRPVESLAPYGTCIVQFVP